MVTCPAAWLGDAGAPAPWASIKPVVAPASTAAAAIKRAGAVMESASLGFCVGHKDMQTITFCKRGSPVPHASVFVVQERPAFQLFEGLTQLLLRVHDDGAVPGHGLLERLARDQQEADAVFAGLDRDFVAAIEEDQRAVIGLGGRRVRPQPTPSVGTASGADALQNFPAREDVGKGVARRFDRQRFLFPGGTDTSR